MKFPHTFIFVFLDDYVFLLFHLTLVTNCKLVLHLVYFWGILQIIEVTNVWICPRLKFSFLVLFYSMNTFFLSRIHIHFLIILMLLFFRNYSLAQSSSANLVQSNQLLQIGPLFLQPKCRLHTRSLHLNSTPIYMPLFLTILLWPIVLPYMSLAHLPISALFHINKHLLLSLVPPLRHIIYLLKW